LSSLFGLALDSHFAATRAAINALGGPFPVASAPGAHAADPKQRKNAAGKDDEEMVYPDQNNGSCSLPGKQTETKAGILATGCSHHSRFAPLPTEWAQ